MGFNSGFKGLMLDQAVHVARTGIQGVNVVYSKKNEADDTVHSLVSHVMKKLIELLMMAHCDMMYFVYCNWVVARWRQYSTHLHTNSTQNDTMKQNTQNGTYITIRIHNLQNYTETYKT